MVVELRHVFRGSILDAGIIWSLTRDVIEAFGAARIALKVFFILVFFDDFVLLVIHLHQVLENYAVAEDPWLLNWESWLDEEVRIVNLQAENVSIWAE